MRGEEGTQLQSQSPILWRRLGLSSRPLRDSSLIPHHSSLTSGFTLIELLTVISIIGILTTVITVNLGGARKQARDVRRQTDMGTIQSALELEANANGGRVSGTNGQLVTSAGATAGQPWITDPALAAFLSSVPSDPLVNDSTYIYRYLTNTSGTMYFLDAVLEVGKQSDANLGTAPPSTNTAAAFVTGKYWDGKNIHYRVSSGGQ